MATINPDISGLLASAAVARQNGNGAEEARLIDAVLAIDPDHPHALNARGMRALAENDVQTAAAAFARAAAADPKEPALWINVAKAQRLLGDDKGERQSLDRALDADRTHFMAWLRKAELHQRLGETADAVRCWQAVLTMAASFDPVPPALVEVLGSARSFVGEHMRSFNAAVAQGLAADREGLGAAELRRFDACVDHMLGRRRIYANECAGAHFPFLPADEFFDRAHFPWLEAIEAKTDVIRAEFEALVANQRGGFKPYVRQESGTPDNKWSALDGRLDWSACFLWEYGVKNDAVCEQCPETAAALEAIPRAELPGRAPTAFFSVLKPRTQIPPHTGVSNTRTIIHLPLIVPEGCGFRVGGETREWRPGEAFAFDDTIEHEAWNDSDSPRAVLIFDVWNPYLTETERRLLQRFYSVADASGYNTEPKGGL